MKKPRKKQVSSTGRKILLTVLAVIFLVNITGVGIYCGMIIKNQRALAKLSDYTKIEEVVPVKPSIKPSVDEESGGTPTGEPDEPEPTAPAEPTILPQYAVLHEMNPELFGWIRIEGTPIDYPVMYSPDEPNKYHHSNFEGGYSPAGLPFLSGDCAPESENLIIYGHNMTGGTMFHSLLEYAEEDFWKEHPIIEFSTLYEAKQFEIVAAFYDRVYYVWDDVFKFYQVIELEDEAEFDEAIRNFEAKRIYNTGVEATYGDQLITLVTCSYHTNNGRFVVVAREIQ